MKIETVEEFLKRGGKIDKITEFKHAGDPSFFVSQRAKQEAFKKKQEGLKNGNSGLPDFAFSILRACESGRVGDSDETAKAVKKA